MWYLNLLSQVYVAYQERIHFEDCNAILSTDTLYALKTRYKKGCFPISVNL